MKWIDKSGNFATNVITVDDMQVINPTEEHYKHAGYSLYVEPMPTGEELLAQSKEIKIAEIRAYDASEDVNSFSLNGMEVWINREDRIGTTRAIELDKANGLTESEIWINGTRLKVNCDKALALLAILGHYAYTAFNKTQEHIYNVRQLKSVKDVEKYNYKTGYPEKLNLKTK